MFCQFTTPVAPVQAFAWPRTAVLARAQSRGLDRCAAAWGFVLGQSRPRSRRSSLMSMLNSLLIHDHDLGTVRKATVDEIISAARVCVAHRMRRGASLSSPTAARDYLVLHFAALPYEVFCVIYLDSRHRVIECQDFFRGTIDSASVHPREVVKEALRRNAAACLLAHNHPSGVAEPSPADELITRQLKAALQLVDIRVLDHLVVAGAGCISFADRGLL